MYNYRSMNSRYSAPHWNHLCNPVAFVPRTLQWNSAANSIYMQAGHCSLHYRQQVVVNLIASLVSRVIIVKTRLGREKSTRRWQELGFVKLPHCQRNFVHVRRLRVPRLWDALKQPVHLSRLHQWRQDVFVQAVEHFPWERATEIHIRFDHQGGLCNAMHVGANGLKRSWKFSAQRQSIHHHGKFCGPQVQ